jgi:uncharacterized protein YjbI with pentapeptide repeats
MANPEHFHTFSRGLDEWNRWRLHTFNMIVSDPDDTDNLRETKPDLTGVDFRSKNLRRAIFKYTKLTGANLSRSSLHDADFTGADLCGANLWGTYLGGTIFRNAQLRGADFTAATFSGTIFGAVDLRNTKGLEAAKHLSPSTIGIDTIYASQGNIPDVFLQGAGVPEAFITYARSLVAKAIEFYSCFISYSTKDQEFAGQLHADLRAQGLRCWFASEDLKIGDAFQERIEESIRLFDKIMIVLSEASIQSRWVEREMNAAREREDRENRVVLFPIRIDDSVIETSKPWAADIRRTRHIGDFREWKDHDSYQKGLERLLQDLKSDASAEAPKPKPPRTGRAD